MTAALRTARHREVELITALLAHERQSGRTVPGIIGRQARATLKRMPSEVYWSGTAAVPDPALECRNHRLLPQPAALNAQPVRVGRDEDGNPTVDTGPWAHLPEPEASADWRRST